MNNICAPRQTRVNRIIRTYLNILKRKKLNVLLFCYSKNKAFYLRLKLSYLDQFI